MGASTRERERDEDWPCHGHVHVHVLFVMPKIQPIGIISSVTQQPVCSSWPLQCASRERCSCVPRRREAVRVSMCYSQKSSEICTLCYLTLCGNIGKCSWNVHTMVWRILLVLWSLDSGRMCICYLLYQVLSMLRSQIHVHCDESKWRTGIFLQSSNGIGMIERGLDVSLNPRNLLFM